ncbi:MAG: amino acid ABC transporter ATP-binding protein [Lachnospiraceae bacterium]|nr:amino acid ABC transporter ATP-binding protein [Lachnospiraceae bacterium]
MSLFEIKNCKKQFDGNPVIDGISFKVDEGEVVAIIGSSGSGKTTLLRICTFLEYMNDGEMSYLGKKVVTSENGIAKYIGQNKLSIDAMNNNKELTKIKNYFGLVFQNFNLFPHWTVLKNIIDAPISVEKRNKEVVIDRAMYYLKKMGIENKAYNYPCELSGGQQQRVAIARALCMEPKIIYFDEPTSALDPELTQEVLRVIKELANEKRTMVIVTHEMNFARDVADRVIFVDNGVIVEEGNAKEVISNPKMERTKKFLQKYED